MIEPIIRMAGDSAVLVEFPPVISEENAIHIKTLHKWLDEKGSSAVRECVPGYSTLLVIYDATVMSYTGISDFIKEGISESEESLESNGRLIWLPVCYSNELGPDLEDVAEHSHLTVQEVIELHTEPDYFVYFTGFLPSFPFLGGMSKRLSTPRLNTPRTLVPGGSVGIAGDQTGVYPLESPGGWRLIGRTPVLLFDKRREDPFVLHSGDRIRFYAVTRSEYDNLSIQGLANPLPVRIEEISAKIRSNVL